MTDDKTEEKTVTKEECRKALDAVMRLCACAVNGEIPDADWIRGMDLDLLYKAAKQHLLTAVVGYALESAGIHDHAFLQAKAKAMRKLGLMDAEMTVKIIV